MNNNLEFENEDPSPDSIEDNHPRTNYGEGFTKQETLEEAAKIFKNDRVAHGYDITYDDGFLDAAKWQAEQDKNKYSEEDMKSFGEFCADYDYRCFGKHTQEEMLKIWFEQFKKK